MQSVLYKDDPSIKNTLTMRIQIEAVFVENSIKDYLPTTKC